jgi:hypothetical protein
MSTDKRMLILWAQGYIEVCTPYLYRPIHVSQAAAGAAAARGPSQRPHLPTSSCSRLTGQPSSCNRHPSAPVCCFKLVQLPPCLQDVLLVVVQLLVSLGTLRLSLRQGGRATAAAISGDSSRIKQHTCKSDVCCVHSRTTASTTVQEETGGSSTVPTTSCKPAGR